MPGQRNHRRPLATSLIVLGLAACTSTRAAGPTTTPAEGAPATPTVASNAATTPTATATATTATIVPTTPSSTTASTTADANPATSASSALVPGGAPGGPTSIADPRFGQPIVALAGVPTVPLPSTTKPNDNLARRPAPGDGPIIDAYVAMLNTYTMIASHAPVDPNASALGSLGTDGWLVDIRAELARHRDASEVMNTALGLTLRPYVIESKTATQATVFDCQLDGTYWASSPSGAPAPGETAAVKQFGARAALVKVGDRWLVDSSQPNGGACFPE